MNTYKTIDMVCAGQGWSCGRIRSDREGDLPFRSGYRQHPDAAV